MIESASFATGARGWLAIATRGGVELCDVSRPNRAVPMPGIAARELRGICASNQRLITYGDRGLKEWRWTGDRWLSVHTLALDGIRDVSHTAERIAVLHGEVITVYDRRWRLANIDHQVWRGARDSPRRSSIARSISRSGGASRACDIERDVHCTSRVARLQRIVDDGRTGVFAAALEDGETVVLIPHVKSIEVIERYPTSAWFIGAHRLGDLLRPAGVRGVHVDRIVTWYDSARWATHRQFRAIE